jgi:hypothetical protein
MRWSGMMTLIDRPSPPHLLRIDIDPAEMRRLVPLPPQLTYLDVIRELLPRDGFFVPELSQVGFTSYGNVLRDQRMSFANRIHGALLDNPDFKMLAKSFGVDGYRVASPPELRPVLRQVLGTNVPVLIEVVVAPDSEVSPWEFIHPRQ